MRRAGGLVVALLILGLAAAGLISAQKNVTHSSSAGGGFRFTCSIGTTRHRSGVASQCRERTTPIRRHPFWSDDPRGGGDGVGPYLP